MFSEFDYIQMIKGILIELDFISIKIAFIRKSITQKVRPYGNHIINYLQTSTLVGQLNV